jgi:hypothetical protein
MDAAIAKHGKIELPSGSHIDDFYDRINKNKQAVAQ